MAETVSTGGNMQFQYRREHRPKPTKEYRIEIEEAYDKARVRKAKERRNKIIMWTVIVLVLILLFGIWWFTRN